MKRVVFSSLEATVALLKANPKLLGIPAFQPLRALVESLPIKSVCCGQKADLSAHRLKFEAALRSLTALQRQQIKSILGVDEIAYFARSGNGLVQKTV